MSPLRLPPKYPQSSPLTEMYEQGASPWLIERQHSSAREGQSDPGNERILISPGELAVTALVGFQTK
jgi:hypothetical protein